mmetsp:Transcript_105896/g.252628  ORF Transcript_105896/g.252628 Transcript_105896/m.252628 type:complete len:205 (+) Transcript_105896:899-1513(+)
MGNALHLGVQKGADACEGKISKSLALHSRCWRHEEPVDGGDDASLWGVELHQTTEAKDVHAVHLLDLPPCTANNLIGLPLRSHLRRSGDDSRTRHSQRAHSRNAQDVRCHQGVGQEGVVHDRRDRRAEAFQLGDEPRELRGSHGHGDDGELVVLGRHPFRHVLRLLLFVEDFELLQELPGSSRGLDHLTHLRGDKVGHGHASRA